MTQQIKSKAGFALGLIAIAAVARLAPHPANVTPILAMALVSGTAFGRKSWSILIPLLAMFVSDLAIGFHDQMVSVYGSIVLVAFIGFGLSLKATPLRIAAASVLSSVVFFLVTNFTIWIGSDMYPRNGVGLVECYTMALPFLRNGLVGDLAYSALLFGAYALLVRKSAHVSNTKLGTI